MPTYKIYAPGSLTFSGSTVTLPTSYNHTTNSTLLITDNDDFLTGDSQNDENGDDNNQFGTATTAGGLVTGGATTKVFVEEHYTLTAPGQPTIRVYRIEIDAPTGNGILVGYLPSAQLVPGVSYRFTTTNTSNFTSPRYTDLTGALCLAAGMRVSTMAGNRAAGRLVPGDLVRTRDHGFQPLRWIGRQRIGRAALAANSRLGPVRIAMGALGDGIPRRDLLVSRQHRMLVSSRIAQRMFGAAEVLIPAIRLVGLPGITLDRSARPVTYIHLLFDQHEVIFAEGAPTESLLLGPEARATIPAPALDEIFAIFPDLRDHDQPPSPALQVPANHLQKRLIERHAWNDRPLLDSAPGDRTAAPA